MKKKFFWIGLIGTALISCQKNAQDSKSITTSKNLDAAGKTVSKTAPGINGVKARNILLAQIAKNNGISVDQILFIKDTFDVKGLQGMIVRLPQVREPHAAAKNSPTINQPVLCDVTYWYECDSIDDAGNGEGCVIEDVDIFCPEEGGAGGGGGGPTNEPEEGECCIRPDQLGSFNVTPVSEYISHDCVQTVDDSPAHLAIKHCTYIWTIARNTLMGYTWAGQSIEQFTTGRDKAAIWKFKEKPNNLGVLTTGQIPPCVTAEVKAVISSILLDGGIKAEITANYTSSVAIRCLPKIGSPTIRMGQSKATLFAHSF